jgi:hypothetical protein
MAGDREGREGKMRLREGRRETWMARKVGEGEWKGEVKARRERARGGDKRKRTVLERRGTG